MMRRESERVSRAKLAIGSVISIGRGEYGEYMERQKVSIKEESDLIQYSASAAQE